VKQIYDFEKYNPPAINENILKNEMKKRNTQKQVIMLAVAAVLVQICVVMFGFMCAKIYPVILIMCGIYVFVSFLGGAAIAAVYVRKGGSDYE